MQRSQVRATGWMILAVSLAATAVAAPRLYVDQSAAPAGDGLTWGTAYQEVRDALTAADSDPNVVEIWVASGTYTPDVPSGSRFASFILRSGLGLYGGFAGGETLLSQRDPLTNLTILSGDLNGDDSGFTNNGENAYHVLTSNGVDRTAILDGFTVTRGNADFDDTGAGLLNEGGAPTIRNCIFTGNIASSHGGGIGNRFSGDPLVIDCQFIANEAGNGAALSSQDTCVPEIVRCVFRDNVAGTEGGAIYSRLSDVTLVSCVFLGNAATSGGAIWSTEGSLLMVNGLCSGNSASNNGGAVGSVLGAATLRNTTLASNVAGGFGGGLFSSGANVLDVANAILWENSDGGGTDESAQLTDFGGSVTVDYTTVQGLSAITGTGNLAGDPLFADRLGGDATAGTLDDDLQLTEFSPAVNAGDDASLPLDGLDLDDDGDANEPLPLDLAGAVRSVGPAVDMGAYEFLPADCNLNGIPDPNDIASGFSNDCNANGIPDECEIAAGTPGGPFFCMVDCDPDCNGNGIPDECDISSGFSLDTDLNGVPDECEDCNSNGTPDGVDISMGTSEDCDLNGVPDECEVLADTDGDGTVDCLDDCPNDPNKILPGICGCGVADIDSDGDGTEDCLDECPDDPNLVLAGACGCGIPETDGDGDGTPDCIDECPSDPNKILAGACGCGNPETDTDGDGTPDCVDLCPADPNKIDPGQCGCGVSDLDSDGDGTSDCVDNCPADPNKIDPGICGCGTADVDSDGDSTLDCFDNCPNDPLKVEPGDCGCGVAETDTDGDGTPDCNDDCPDDPNKVLPGKCGCGVDETPDCPQKTIFVDVAAVPGGDGLSWLTAFDDLQDGLSLAAADPNFTTVWVAAGTYTPSSTGNRLASFTLRNNLSIMGGFAGVETLLSQRDPNTNVTILSGDLNGDDGPAFANATENSVHVVNSVGTGPGAILDGFTITGGYDGGLGGGRGAGILNLDGSPTIRNTKLIGNFANSNGGGMFNLNGGAPTLSNCLFEDNVASTSKGGGMYNFAASPVLIDCTFRNNDAVFTGGAMLNQQNASPHLTRVTFEGNTAFWGGAISNEEGSSPTLIDCVFNANVASGNGGAISNDVEADPVIDGCTFTGNIATRGGGAIGNIIDCDPVISNCTFTGNQAALGAGLVIQENCDVSVTDSDFTGNIASDPADGTGGGVYVIESTLVLDNVDFTGNQASSDGGGIFILSCSPTLSNLRLIGNQATRGAAIYVDEAGPIVKSVRFFDNAAVDQGGAVYQRDATSQFFSCEFFGNSAGLSGGAHFSANSNLLLAGSAFSGNTTSGDGGGLFNTTTSLDVLHCTFAGNTAGGLGGAFRGIGGSSLVLTNSIVWGNSDSGGSGETSQVSEAGVGSPTVNFCVIQGFSGLWGGTGNLAGDPGFIDAAGSDLLVGTLDDNIRITASSIAYNTGDATLRPADGADLDEDLDTLELLPLDLDGNDRVRGGQIDMGAYEADPGDCNNNGNPDPNDIASGSSEDCNNNNIPDECESLPDSDGDGEPDCSDECPADPNKILAGDCGCGAPETDSDGDGTPDCVDLCPDDPNKVDPGVCGCGVDEADSDGDGTPDCDDLCPTDPDKILPGNCGCNVATCPCEADLNSDGTVNLTDLAQLLTGFGRCLEDVGFNPKADINGDGCVDLTDLSILLSTFGESCP